MASNQMLQEVYETFSDLGAKYPTIEPYLTKCYTDIKEKFVSEQASLNQSRKENVKVTEQVRGSNFYKIEIFGIHKLCGLGCL